MPTPPAPAPTPNPAVSADPPVDRRIRRVTRQDRRGLVYIIGIAIAFHVMVGYFLFRPAAEVLPKGGGALAGQGGSGKGRTVEVAPSFTASASAYTDEDSGDHVIEREYTVNIGGTNLANSASIPAARDGGAAAEPQINRPALPPPSYPRDLPAELSPSAASPR